MPRFSVIVPVHQVQAYLRECLDSVLGQCFGDFELIAVDTVGAFNKFWYHKAPLRRRGELQRLASFFHPLDGLPHWNRIYGGTGFVQWQCVVPHEWFVPVTPGTRYVTVGGAIGADIHGKNHHISGSFTRHVRSMDLLTADGQVRTLTPGSELFDATCGGMGLTGLVLSATFDLLPVETSVMSVDTERLPDLDTLLATLTATGCSPTTR